MADARSREAWQPFTIGGVARFAVASRWRLLGVQCLFALAVAGTVVWFISRAWMQVIDAAIDRMPQSGAIVDGRLEWPSNATLFVEGPAGEPFMRVDVQPGGLTNVVETVDLVMAFEADRVLLGSSLGLGLLVVPYPPGVDVPFNKTDLEPWWGARAHMVLMALGLLIILGLLISWSFLGCLYMVPVKIFSINRVTWRGAWQLASAAHLPGALVMCAGMLFYGLKQLELIGLVFVWAIHLVLPWFYLFFSPIFAPKPLEPEAKAKPEAKPEAKPAKKANPFDDSTGGKETSKTDNPFG